MHKQLKKHEVTLRDRFIVRVLLTPFLLLVVVGGISFWQLNEFLVDQAVSDLQVAAQATSIRLEREIAIRETVLKNTGEEIATVKNNYVTDLATLENNRSKCREFYLQRYTFTNSPDDVCELFAQGARPSLSLIEDLYVENAKNLQTNEISNINQRLTAYKQFFPETLALIVMGEDEEIVSSALTGDTALNTDHFADFAAQAINQPLQGKIIQIENFKLAVFAFPTVQGSVLAAFDVDNPNFIKPSWSSTPIDTNDAAAIITETDGNIVYPGVKDELELLSATQGISDNSSARVYLSGVENLVVVEPVGESDWKVLVASPEAIVFAPVRDTQFVAFVVVGVFLVGFLWVGTFFIKKTTDNLAQLVTGAMVYGSGRLDYKLNINASEKELKQLADTMNYMAHRIAQSEKEMDERNKDFISIATHELRAPMTSIIGYLSMLKEESAKKLSKQNTLLLDNAYDGTIRLRELVNDMLDAARLEGGREEFKFNTLDITKYVKDTVESMKIVAKEKKVTISYDDKHKANIIADEGKLRIILNNFMSNAIKYNKSGGKVIITHSHHEGQLVTAVANSGPAIPVDQQAHMFEKFFRVDTPEHKKVVGTGVGMYVTKQYVVAMGGKIWFTSKAGENTVFYFSLPIASAHNTQSQQKASTPKPSNSKWIMRWRRRMR